MLKANQYENVIPSIIAISAVTCFLLYNLITNYSPLLLIPFSVLFLYLCVLLYEQRAYSRQQRIHKHTCDSVLPLLHAQKYTAAADRFCSIGDFENASKFLAMQVDADANMMHQQSEESKVQTQQMSMREKELELQYYKQLNQLNDDYQRSLQDQQERYEGELARERGIRNTGLDLASKFIQSNRLEDAAIIHEAFGLWPEAGNIRRMGAEQTNLRQQIIGKEIDMSVKTEIHDSQFSRSSVNGKPPLAEEDDLIGYR